MKQNKLMTLVSIGALMMSLVAEPLMIQAVESTSDSQAQIDDSSHLESSSSEPSSVPSDSSSTDPHATDESSSKTTTSDQTTTTSEAPDLVSSIEVSVPKSKMTIGQTVQVSTTVSPSTADQTVQYNSSNSAVASIDSHGKITGLATGQTEITVTSQDGLKTVKLTMTVVKTSVVYQSHIQNIGWQKTVTDGAMSGTQGKALRLEGVKVNLDNATYAGRIEYQVHIQGIGWQSKVSNGAMAGTTGQARRLEAIKLSLTDELSSRYDIYYRVHVQNLGWLS